VIAGDEEEARYRVTQESADPDVEEDDWDVHGTTEDIRHDAADADNFVCTVLL